MFEECFVVLEGVEDCVVMVSGMVVIMVVCLVYLKNGDYIVVFNGLFGVMVQFFLNILLCIGIMIIFVLQIDVVVWVVVIWLEIKLFFFEMLFNLLIEIVDIWVLIVVVYVKGILVVVDNCFCMLIL